MNDAPLPAVATPTQRRRWRWIGASLLILAAAGIVAAICHERKQDGLRHALEVQRRCDDALRGVTAVRAWAAGMRTAREDQFCGCPAVRGGVVYESADAAEVRDLVSAFVCRPFGDLGPKPGACSPLTVEFYRGKELALSMNYRGQDSFCSRWSAEGRSSWWLPFTEEGQRRIDGWIAKHDLWAKVRSSLR